MALLWAIHPQAVVTPRDGDGEMYLLTQISKSNLLLPLKKPVSFIFATYARRKTVIFLKYAIKTL